MDGSEPSTRDPTALVLLMTWLSVGVKIPSTLGLLINYYSFHFRRGSNAKHISLCIRGLCTRDR
jgi:hypothetical protein